MGFSHFGGENCDLTQSMVNKNNTNNKQCWKRSQQMMTNEYTAQIKLLVSVVWDRRQLWDTCQQNHHHDCVNLHARIIHQFSLKGSRRLRRHLRRIRKIETNRLHGRLELLEPLGCLHADWLQKGQAKKLQSAQNTSIYNASNTIVRFPSKYS